MDCRRFKREELAAELELAERTEVSRDHRRDCPACRQWCDRQRLIGRSLLDLRLAPPPTVNVVTRVRRATREASVRPARAQQWGLVALPLSGLALLFGLWNSGIRLQSIMESAVRGMLFLRTMAESMWSPLASLLRAAGRLCLALLAALANAMETIGSLEPWLIGTAALCTLMMATSVLLVVGRDIGRHRPERGDTY